MAAIAIPLITTLISTFGPKLMDVFSKKKPNQPGQGGSGLDQFTPLSNLNRGQEDVLNQLSQGLLGPQSNALSYLKDLFSNDSQSLDRFSAPYLRQFNEQTVPGLAEQFGGVGALSSSGFQNALGQASAGLSENLAAIREGAKLQGLGPLNQLINRSLSTSPFDYVQRGPGSSASTSFGSTLGKNLPEIMKLISSLIGKTGPNLDFLQTARPSGGR